jgi:hypothetical protein
VRRSPSRPIHGRGMVPGSPAPTTVRRPWVPSLVLLRRSRALYSAAGRRPTRCVP